MARPALGLLMLAGATAGCSLEGFADGAGGSGGGAASANSSAGPGGSGAGGDGTCRCDCGPWDAVRVSEGGPGTAATIAATPEGWAVTWQDARNGNPEVYFARLDDSGARLGDELRVTDDAADSLSPVLVWNGSNHALAWADTRDGTSDVYMAFVDPAGTKTFGDALVWGGTGAPSAPTMGWSQASGYVLTWEDFRDGGYKLHTGNVGTDGTVIHADERITDPASGDCRAPALARSTAEYGVAWQDTRDGDQEVYFRRIDALGYPIGVETRVTNVAGSAEDVAIAWTGSMYSLVWVDGRDGRAIWVASLSEGGALRASEQRVSDGRGSTHAPSVVWADGEQAVAWDDDRDGTPSVRFRRLDESGAPLGPDTPVAGQRAAAQHPSLAWSGSAFGLVWQDRRDGDDAIWFATCSP